MFIKPYNTEENGFHFTAARNVSFIRFSRRRLTVWSHCGVFFFVSDFAGTFLTDSRSSVVSVWFKSSVSESMFVCGRGQLGLRFDFVWTFVYRHLRFVLIFTVKQQRTSQIFTAWHCTHADRLPTVPSSFALSGCRGIQTWNTVKGQRRAESSWQKQQVLFAVLHLRTPEYTRLRVLTRQDTRGSHGDTAVGAFCLTCPSRSLVRSPVCSRPLYEDPWDWLPEKGSSGTEAIPGTDRNCFLE